MLPVLFTAFFPTKVQTSWYNQRTFQRNMNIILEFSSLPAFLESHESSVCVALGYGLDDRGSRVRFPGGTGNFSLHHRIQNASGAHPPSYLMVPGSLSLGVNRPRREVDHSPPSMPMSRMRGAIPLLPHYAFMGWCLVKHGDNFTFTFFTRFSWPSENMVCPLTFSGKFQGCEPTVCGTYKCDPFNVTYN
jgi:hypothetical protein